MLNFTSYLFERHGSSHKPFIYENGGIVDHSSLRRRVCGSTKNIIEMIGRNNNVLLMADNNSFFIESYLATMGSGNTCVLMDTKASQKEVEEVIGACNIDMCLVQKKYSDLVPESVGYLIEGFEIQHEMDDFEFVDSCSDDTAAIIFTSGSTGQKKGVMLSHGNLISNTESIISYLSIDECERALVLLPFYYCFGASILHTHLRAGGSIVINNKPFLASIKKDIDAFECSSFSGVPSTYQILVNKTDFLSWELPSLRYMAQAGGQLPKRYIERIIDAFPDKDFVVMYGATEATARLSYLPPEKNRDKMGSIGKGIPGVTLKLVDSSGNEVGTDEVGEIVAKGANIMKGYYCDPDETSSVIKDGWYHTGDLAVRDEEGYIYIIGRSKNMIKSGGFRISPKEVEDIVLGIDDIESCVVIGTLHDVMGEAVTVVVQGDFEDEEGVCKRILERCKGLPAHKTPQRIEFVDSFPLNPSNKIDLQELKNRINRRLGL